MEIKKFQASIYFNLQYFICSYILDKTFLQDIVCTALHCCHGWILDNRDMISDCGGKDKDFGKNNQP